MFLGAGRRMEEVTCSRGMLSRGNYWFALGFEKVPGLVVAQLLAFTG